MAKKKRDSSEVLKKVFRLPQSQTKGGRRRKRVNQLRYIAVSVMFAAIISLVFDRNLWDLYNKGGDLTSAVEGVFSFLIPIIFAIISVYLIVHVLHPHFGKRPVPESLKKIIEEDNIPDNLERDEMYEFVKDLVVNDEDIRTYLDTVNVKSDIAVTLGTSLVAFFAGMYAYVAAYTLEYADPPGILTISICFAVIVFSVVYTILKTMKVLWDV